MRALSWNAAAPALLVAAALFSAAPASAQITKINTADLLTMFIRGVDVASDTSGGALVVSAQDAVLAHCITADGVAHPVRHAEARERWQALRRLSARTL